MEKMKSDKFQNINQEIFKKINELAGIRGGCGDGSYTLRNTCCRPIDGGTFCGDQDRDIA